MKGYYLHTLFVLIACVSWGQRGNVQLTVESDEVVLNQPFSISLKSNVEGDIVENWPSNFSKGYGVQSMSRYVQDVNTGKMMQEHIVIFTGVFTKAGKYKLGPLYIKAGNKTYPSNTIKINVVAAPSSNSSEDFSKQQMKQPAFGVVEVSALKIYEGEPLVVSGRVYARERTYGRPVLRRPFSIEGVTDVFPLQQTEMWENVVLKRKSYESFSFEKKVVFPIGSGTLTIQPFEIFLPFTNQDFNVISSVPAVEVMPLPSNAPNEFIGLVGEFDVIQNFKTKKVKQGDIIQVEVVVSGVGNLHAIETPKMPLPKGMQVYGDAEVKEDYIMNTQGASGKVTYTYYVQVAKEGKQTIQPVKIAYFNPKLERYVSVAADRPIVVDVMENANFDVTAAIDSNALSSSDADVRNLQGGKGVHFFNKNNNWIWYSAGGLLFVGGLFFFLLRKPKPEEKSLSDADGAPLVNPTFMKVSTVTTLINDVETHVESKDANAFYCAVDRALIALMRYKLKKSEDHPISRNQLVSEMEEANLDAVIGIKRLFDLCDQARYGMGISEADQRCMLSELRSLV